MAIRRIALLLIITITAHTGFAQRTGKAKPLIYVDKTGIIRYTADGTEAAFFGVNYTVPFAYGYRSHKALGVDLKKAIDEDVYHLARLGVDAFRVHVWDTEITDAAGNLLTNDHLDLFDYLLSKLKERKIRILLTPIAFWGNGYPEKDENTGSFSSIFGKDKALVNDTAIRAQENYVKQFFVHVNPYTGLSYKDDPDIIATEINNEPHHSGPLSAAASYVNRLAAAIRSTGWNKPVFYNISESPSYASAVAAANIDGVSFQWYPTGLVANRTLQDNLLPNVDRYAIPFDTIPAFKNKARMVYEFDAGDVLQPVMYPAMARSFRTAGFQWATQFAYDPLHTAYANTEYQTHYLNLAYTPEKAISFLIAGKIFRQLPRIKNYGVYPADTLFGAARVSYAQQLSEWNTAAEFYYTGNTNTNAIDPGQLSHMAGTGNSPLVQYKGTGAYFLDKIEDGVWRLEVMPDVIPLKDPFERTSPAKELRRVQWNQQSMTIRLPDMGDDFTLSAVNKDNHTQTNVAGNTFTIYPGAYLIIRKGRQSNITGNKINGVIGLSEFVAPQPVRTELAVNHTPFTELTAGTPATIEATIAGIDSTAHVWLEGTQLSGQWFKLDMHSATPSSYTATLPAELLQPGLLQYRLIIQQGNSYTTFPGQYTGDPYAWDNYHRDTWQTYIAAPGTMLSLLDATKNKDLIMLPTYTPGAYTSGDRSEQLAIRISGNGTKTDTVTGVSRAVAAQLKGRSQELQAFNTVVLRARVTGQQTANARVALISANATAIAAVAPLTNEFRDIELPLNSFKSDQTLLLPRPYPGFMPLWLKTGDQSVPDLRTPDKIEITNIPAAGATPYTIEIIAVWLKVK
ncbi:cellulase family glycosylhydrolase [Chitinophaga filiformis]|uniref:Cellulase (Glycosyl hydrolase family 5) n=1 Tax=Chitinophaga filiformis TaxID=104663 RepID=A0A1G8A5M1_CHIFI|nr:cellulase family glycosylhydrolase [Chitinophaga filiformis]SDH16171.1 Cellulase (glycosyl hydrolase family 5) [Chitinophaga filiformis]